MKLLLLAVLFSGSIAMAIPHVGDVAHYKMTHVQANVTKTGTMTYTVKSYDEATKMFTITSSTQVAGEVQPNMNETMQPMDQAMQRDVELAALLKDCAGNGGVDEVVTMGNGKTIKTCRMLLNTGNVLGYINYADVPFNYARARMMNSTMAIDFLMNDYTVAH